MGAAKQDSPTGKLPVLDLAPILPTRPIAGCGDPIRYGYELRIEDGPRVLDHDPLLAAVGADVVELDDLNDHAAGAQEDAFAPGRRAQLSIERTADGLERVAVRDADRVLSAGTLDDELSARLVAAAEFGFRHRALVLSETRGEPDRRRASLKVLIYNERTVKVRAGSLPAYRSAPRPPRNSAILVLDGPVPKWWDATGNEGPIAIDELTEANRFEKELGRYRRAHRKLSRAHRSDWFDPILIEDRRRALDRAALSLWLSVRASFAESHLVGLLPAEGERVVWNPVEWCNGGRSDVVESHPTFGGDYGA